MVLREWTVVTSIMLRLFMTFKLLLMACHEMWYRASWCPEDDSSLHLQSEGHSLTSARWIDLKFGTNSRGWKKMIKSNDFNYPLTFLLEAPWSWNITIECIMKYGIHTLRLWTWVLCGNATFLRFPTQHILPVCYWECFILFGYTCLHKHISVGLSITGP